jgi:hypothetical protein
MPLRIFLVVWVLPHNKWRRRPMSTVKAMSRKERHAGCGNQSEGLLPSLSKLLPSRKAEGVVLLKGLKGLRVLLLEGLPP